jgi:putative flippase GtrA
VTCPERIQWIPGVYALFVANYNVPDGIARLTGKDMDADQQSGTLRPTLALWRRDIGSVVRYAVVGLAQNAAFYAVTLVLLRFGLMAWQATIILYPIATVLSFLANRSWSFANRERSGSQFRKYVLLYVAVYPAAIFLNWVQETGGVPSWLASLITIGVAAGAMFVVLNSWVFRR